MDLAFEVAWNDVLEHRKRRMLENSEQENKQHKPCTRHIRERVLFNRSIL